MKYKLLLAISAISALYFLKPSQIDVPPEREAYEIMLSKHQFNSGQHYNKDYTYLPKYDRPDLGWELDFIMTMDPKIGRPSKEKLLEIIQSRKLKPSFDLPGTTSNRWFERGPNNVGGRTRALAWDPNDINGTKVWAGGVTGGLWYNNDITDPTSSWTKVDDTWDNLAITSIAFDPTNTQVIYVGTGEGWGTGASRGLGIWKSTDGGTTWNQLNATNTFHYVNDLIVRNESGSGVLYAGTKSNNYEGEPTSFFHGENGLYRSTDGGQNFSQVSPSIDSDVYAIADLEIDSDNNLWAGSQSNSFAVGGGAIFKSNDGINWVKVFQSNVNDFSGRVEIATANNDPNKIYAVVENDSKAYEIVRTNDGGNSWSSSSDSDVDAFEEPVSEESADPDNQFPPDDFTRRQAWYNLILKVDPSNDDIVYAGGIDLYKSIDQGNSWEQISHWYGGFDLQYVHADQHNIAFNPNDNTQALFSHDGGISFSSNMNIAVPTIESRNKDYNVTQFYSVAIHPTAGTDYFLAGTQDNGTQRFNSSGIDETDEVTGGDGGYTFIDQNDPNIQITSYIYNSYYVSNDGGANFNSISEDQGTGLFINPADYDDNLKILYTNGDSKDEVTQELISGIGRFRNIGGTPTRDDIAGIDFGANISHIKASPYTTASTKLYIGTQAGRVFILPNANLNPANGDKIEITSNNFPTANVSSIELGASEDQILVTFSNYGVSSVWESLDGGTSWDNKDQNDNLPDMPIRWALYNPENSNEVVLATELGAYTTSNISDDIPNWSIANEQFANVRVDMLQVRESDLEIVAATHGRGLFSSSFADINQAPTIDPDQVFNVDENESNNFNIGTITATDPESDDFTITEVAGDDNNIFSIATDGTITIEDNTNLNHELAASYILTIRAEDINANQSEETITININDINESPTIQPQSFQVLSTAQDNDIFGQVTASDEDESEILSYSIISGNSDGTFDINSSTGELIVAIASQLNDTGNPDYTLEIQVSDDELPTPLTASAFVEIDVTDNESPVCTNNGVTFTIAEDAADDDLVGTVLATDTENDPLTFSIAAGANGDFIIDSDDGEIRVATNATLDFETEPQYSITVEITATSGNTTPIQASFTVDITDANEAPSIDPQSMRIDENSSIGTVVINNNGTAINNAVIATDPDGDNLTYAITAGDPNNFFDINAQGQIIVQSNINYEANQNFSLTVQVTDPGSLTANATVSISVNDVNEPPVIPANQTFSISENASNNDAVGTVSATDPDALDPSFRQLTYSFSPASTVFAINNSGQITVADASQLDFDATPQYTLTVQVSDGTSPVSSTITINVDEFIGIPVVADQTFTIAENSADGATIGTVVATDPDTPLSGLSFSIISGNTSNATAIDNDGVLTIADSAAYDFETNPDFELRVRVTDGTNADTATVTIDLTNVNEAPTIANKTIAAPENLPLNSVLGDTEASDVDTENLTYSIVSGNAGQNYALADTGTILVNNAAYFDFETFTRDTLNIRVFDGEFADTARFIIRLTNVNESLTISDSTYTIDENSAKNVTVGSLKAEDIDGDALTFNIVSGNTGDAFALSGKVIVVNNTEQLDFETTPVFNLQVSATDGEFTETAAITIELNDVFELVNDKPQFFPQTFSINENQPKNTQIGTLEATDTVILVNGEPTLRNNEITYKIVNQSFPNAVALDTLTGVLTVNDSAAFDYEGSSFGNFPTIVVNVRVSDGDLSTTAPVTIQIFNVEEPPYIEDQVFSIPENSPAGTLVDKVKAIDGDGAGLSLRIISGNLNSAFFMSNAGTLTVQNPTPLNFEVNPQLVLVVEATDQVDTVTANITINVTDVNDPPKLTGKLFDIDENPAKGDTVGNINVIDDDGLENVIFTILEGNVQGAFTITEDGFIIVENEDAIDFEELRTITLRVLIEDGIFTFEEIVDIQINDVIDNLLITDVEDEIQLKFYPNPVRDRLIVELPGLNDERILISDLSGKILWQSFTNRKALLEINTTSYRPGIYLLMVGQEVFKFRKE